MKVGLVHYWLVQWRGGERVLSELAELFPQAPLYVHVSDQELCSRHLTAKEIRHSFINRLPFARRWYQRYLPLMPLALEQLDLRGYDLVISSESGPAKGVIVPPGALHICYCHSPMRYVWDMYHDYRDSAGRLTRWMMPLLMHYLRLWDQISAQRVDHYVANSNFVAARIRQYYRRDAQVIYPPVAVEEFEVSTTSEPFYLMVGQLAHYKRPDLAVEAFNRSGRSLVVIGDGEQLASLRKLAKPNVRILGHQSFEVIKDHYRRCRALIFPGTEDFGIVPVEAMASGKPVIAFRRGGALETVVDGKTGLFFDEASSESLESAINDFESGRVAFDPHLIRAHALQFSRERFRREFSAFVSSVQSTG